ncbi:MAG: PAS domain S-box protein, partial [Clostridiales bacterium]
MLKNKLISFQAPINFDINKESGRYTSTKSGSAFIDYTVSITDSGYLMQIQDITEQRKAEGVEKSEERLKALMDHNPSLIFMKDELGRYVYLNNAYEKQFVHSKDWYGKTDFDFWSKESAELFQANDTEVLRSGKTIQFLEDSTDLDGTRYCWLNYKFPFIDSKNERYVGGIGIDATPIVLAEEALKDSEEKYKTLVDTLPDAIIVHSNGIIRFVNPAAMELFNARDEEEFIGKPILSILPEEMHEICKQRINQAEVEQTPLIESKFVKLDGSLFYGESTGKGIIYQGKPAVQAVIKDITKRKKVEEQIKLERKRLETILETTPAGVIIVEASDGKVSYINKRARQLYGVNIEGLDLTDAVSKVNAKRIDGSDYPIGESPTGRALKGQEIHNEEVIMEQADGTVIPIFASTAPIFNSEGKVIAAVAIFEDITERKKAEGELKARETRLNNLYENSFDAILLTKPDGTILSANPSAQKMFGMTEEEIIKAGRAGLIVPDENLKQALKERKQKGIVNVELTAKRKDSSTFPIELTSSLFTDADGIVKTSMVIRDISERKKAEETLRESEVRFRSVLDNSLDALYRVNLKTGQYEYLSPAFEDVVGFSPKEFMSMTSEEAMSIIHTDDLSVATESLACLEIEGHVKVDYRVRDSRGKYRWLSNHISLIRDDKGQPLYRDGTIRNITEQKKVEEELRQARNHLEELVEERTSELEGAYKTLKSSELKFKTLTENSVDIIDRQDRQFRHLFVNNIIYKLLGIPPEDFIGKTNRELGMSEELVNLWESKTQEVFDTGKIGHMEFELPTQNGINYYQSILAPEYNSNNEIESVLIMSRDITERKQAEEQLKEIITELERSNQELQSFAYITSHDLQEPLRSIASYAQLIERRYKGQLDSDADDFIDYMVGGATRLQAMIKGLLDYSRVGTKGGEFKDF